jgi:tRNA A-37 threonylcarbamoyl transferase component Bud32
MAFFGKLFGKAKAMDPEEKDRADFEKMRRVREKERLEYYQAREAILVGRDSGRHKVRKGTLLSEPSHPHEAESISSSSGADENNESVELKSTNELSVDVDDDDEASGNNEAEDSETGNNGAAAVASSSNAVAAKRQQNKRASGVHKKAGSGGVKVIVFSHLSELPDDVKESVQRTKIDEVVLEANLDTFANILSFDDKRRPKRRFYTQAQYDVVSAAGYVKEKACNRHAPRMLKKHEDLFLEVTLRQAKKWYKIQHFLGEGGFGGVVEAKVIDKKRHPQNHIAIKYQRLMTRADRRLIAQEASIMQHCSHECVVKMYAGLQVHEESWMIMELLPGGTLKQAAESSSTWGEEEIAYVAEKMLLGIAYLHAEQLVHRDLKNLNIMFTTNALVKIIDFGLCADVSHGPTIAMVGSPFWMAPEMVRGEPHTYPVDIYSFAVCMLELANRKPPNATNVKRALFTAAIFGLGDDHGLDRPEKWSDEFKDFLSLGVAMGPEKRATAAQLLEHPFLKKATTREKMSRKLSQIFTLNSLAVSGI